MNNKNQGVSVAKVISWMTIFFVLYLPLVILVLVAAIISISGFIWSFWVIFKEYEVITGVVLALVFAALTYFLVYPFCKGILRPFFILYNSDRDKRIEITEDDAPELVHLIYKIADVTKNEHPKHIYVSAATNACVFYDTRFTNIFVPVKKNIEVGLGVFRHMSVAETASCIAHEFGHFSQDTMRWGTVVHILNTLIANLMSVNDRWNATVNKLINFPWIIGQAIVLSLACKAAGWILYGITIGYMKIMEFIYKKIQLAHLELSRKMEYEADAVAASIVGSDVYVSFICKIIELSSRDDCFLGTAQRLASQDKLIGNYWKGYSKLEEYIENLTNVKINSSTRLCEPLSQVEDAQLVFESVYSTHPDWKSRLSAVKDANYPKVVEFEGNAWDIVPESIKEKVSEQSIEDLSSLCDSEKPRQYVNDEELDDLIDEKNYWYQYAPYFQRNIIEFDYNVCKPGVPFEPGKNEYLSAIKKYEAARTDYKNALNIKVNHDFTQAIYQGVVYKSSLLPIKKIKDICDEREEAAMQIDKMICEYAMSHTSDIDYIKKVYSSIFYAQTYLENYDEHISGQQNETIDVLNRVASTVNSHQYSTVKDSLLKLNECVKMYGVSKTNKDLFCSFAPKDAIDCIDQFVIHCDSMFIGDNISPDAINLLIYTSNWLREIHKNIEISSKMAVINACLNRHQQESDDLSEDSQLVL